MGLSASAGPSAASASRSIGDRSRVSSLPEDEGFFHFYDLHERIALLQGSHPWLRRGTSWEAFMWQAGRHRALVVRPFAVKFCTAIDSTALRRPVVDGEAVEDDDDEDSQSETQFVQVSAAELFVVFELLVRQDENTDFFPQVSAMPQFERNRENVIRLGAPAPATLRDLGRKAAAVAAGYKSYSYVGCNCQHFVQDLARSIGLNVVQHRDALTPEDEVATVGTMGAVAAAVGYPIYAVATLGTMMGAAIVGGASGSTDAIRSEVWEAEAGCNDDFRRASAAIGEGIHETYAQLKAKHRQPLPDQARGRSPTPKDIRDSLPPQKRSSLPARMSPVTESAAGSQNQQRAQKFNGSSGSSPSKSSCKSSGSSVVEGPGEPPLSPPSRSGSSANSHIQSR